LARTSLSLPFDGTRLRAWRERAGLTQQRLAEACGLSRYQISRWENGTSKPAPGALRPLVEGLARELTDAQNPVMFQLADLLNPRADQAR
jgi:transcriptional regulator with XRE-family HTH domain